MMDRGWRVDGDHHGWPSPGPRQPRPPTQTPMRHPFCWLLQLTNWQAVVWWPTLCDTNDERGDGTRGDAGKPQRVGFFKSRVPHGWAVGTITPFLFPFPLSPSPRSTVRQGPPRDQQQTNPHGLQTARAAGWHGWGWGHRRRGHPDAARYHDPSWSLQQPSTAQFLVFSRGPVAVDAWPHPRRQHAAARGSMRQHTYVLRPPDSAVLRTER